jgi:hypothetical protein
MFRVIPYLSSRISDFTALPKIFYPIEAPIFYHLFAQNFCIAELVLPLLLHLLTGRPNSPAAPTVKPAAAVTNG